MDYLVLIITNAVIALVGFRLGMLYRDARCKSIIAAQARLHERNRRDAEIRGFRDGVMSQLKVETRNASK